MPHDGPAPDRSASLAPDLSDIEKHKLPVLTCSIVVGLLAGIVGALFQWGIAWGQLLLQRLQEVSLGFGMPGWLAPAAGSAVLVWGAIFLVRRYAPEASGSGVPEIEGALAGLRPMRWARVLPVKFLGGVMSLSAGMVLGREGPTVQLGGGLGQMIGRGLHMGRDQLHILIAAGAGAGISAAFNAPLAGILFVIEEMRPHFKYGFLSVQAVVIASGAAALALRRLTSQAPDIAMQHFEPAPLVSLGLFLLRGAMFGVIGYAFNASLVGTLNIFAKLRGRFDYLGGLLVGAAVGFASWKYPHVAGEGYETIRWAVLPHSTVGLLLAVFAARFVANMLCYGCGAPGGIFAPMLALASLFGSAYGIVAQKWFPAWVAQPGMFAVAGMGALFAATVRAPLTGIALTIEMTQNYGLILPLILTCWGATIVAQGLGARPIYTVLLERTLRMAGTKTNPVASKTPSDS